MPCRTGTIGQRLWHVKASGVTNFALIMVGILGNLSLQRLSGTDCIMNYEDAHPGSPEDKILYHYRILEVETTEPFGDQIPFYLLELPRIMHYTDEYDSPVAGWCRIFRNFAIFAKSRSKDDERFGKLERAMRVSGLDDNEIDNYFSVMLTEKEMRPYIEGAKQQGYRMGRQDGFQDGVEKGLAEGEALGRAEGVMQP